MSIPCSLETPEQRLGVKKFVLPMLGDLHHVPLQLTHSNDAAEDLVAETMLRSCENISSLRDTTKGKQWMLRILFNTFLNSCRAKKSHQEIRIIPCRQLSAMERTERERHIETWRHCFNHLKFEGMRKSRLACQKIEIGSENLRKKVEALLQTY